MSHVWRVASTLALGLAIATPLVAQETVASASLIGQRVRVSHCNTSGWRSADGREPCYLSEGELLTISPDAIGVQLEAGAVREIPRMEVQRFERSLGRTRSTGRGALIGGGIGFGLGLLMGVGVAREAGDDPVGWIVTGMPLAGGAVGALIGAAVGSLPRERWALVRDEELTVAVVGGVGAVGVGLRLAF